MVEPLTYDTAPVGESVGPFAYVVPADFNRRRLAALGVDDTLFATWAEPSLLCGQHSWVLRRRFSWAGSVHAKCDIAFLKPVDLGATIHVTGRIAGKYERRGGRYVVFELLTTDPDGEVVCRVENSMLMNFRDVAAARRQRGGVAAATVSREPSERPALRSEPKTLRRDDIVGFYQAEEQVYGAHPSLHNDPALARAAGLADIIAPGRYSIALLNAMFARLYGVGCLAGARYSVSFVGNLLPGLVLQAEATPAGAQTDGDSGTFRTFAVACRDGGSGAPVLSGTASLPMPG
ncbi:MAG TPA: MaoC family dehydratase [Vineibacter sp.]|nr:MaoC family dehydratase [Vineibacter sp.]